MAMRTRHFLAGLGVVMILTGVAWGLVRLPGLSHVGGLAMALLLGLGWKLVGPVPESWSEGLAFAAKRLLRWGIVLMGVRLNLELVLEAGLQILLVDVSVIVVGLVVISWLGRKLGLDPILAMLIAVSSSICGGSAVAAAAPVMRAREHEVALVIPLCSLLGTVVMLAYTLLQHAVELPAEVYGMLVGSTLHEVAQVMAAVGPFPETVEIGTVTKLTRVLFLVPVIGVLGWIFARGTRTAGSVAGEAKPRVAKPWFVVGFLIVGALNTVLWQAWPEQREGLALADEWILQVAAVLMTMAMAALGLQTNFTHLRENGIRALGTAVGGWLIIAVLAMGEIWWLWR